MSFRYYTRELYDRPKANRLHLKDCRLKSEVVVEALLYGCATWSPLKSHYNKLRTAHHRMLLQILGAWCKTSTNRILSYKDAFQRTGYESIVRNRRLLWLGVVLRMGNHRLPERVVPGELDNAGQRWPGKKEE